MVNVLDCETFRLHELEYAEQQFCGDSERYLLMNLKNYTLQKAALQRNESLDESDLTIAFRAGTPHKWHVNENCRLFHLSLHGPVYITLYQQGQPVDMPKNFSHELPKILRDLRYA